MAVILGKSLVRTIAAGVAFFPSCARKPSYKAATRPSHKWNRRREDSDYETLSEIQSIQMHDEAKDRI